MAIGDGVAPGNPTVNTKWRCDINTAYDPAASTQPAATFIQVRGVNSLSPGLDNTTQDASDYDSEGWGADAVTQRKWKLEMTALRKTYAGTTTETYDAGQEKLRAAADNLDIVHVRWYERGVPGGEAYEGLGLVQWDPQGGAPDGLSSVNVTVLGQGKREPITSPEDDEGSGGA